MTDKQGYILAVTVFFAVVAIMSFPYLNARFFSSKTLLVATNEVIDSEDGAEAIVESLAPNTLRITSLGVQAPIIYVEEKKESIYQEALRDGVVHYPGTALPGEFGNTYIFGHSSDYVWSPGDYKTIFARLPQIEIGSEIEITNTEGQIFRYLVTETKVVGPRDLSVLDQFNYEKKLLSVQTSYPLGTALQRFIVVAELQDAE